MENKKYCVIMAGGIGSRFWPISRTSKPKQFLDILGEGKSFLRSTFERFLPVVPPENFLVVTNRDYADIVLEQIPEIGRHQILGEPIGRNTAPCIAYAAFRLNAVDPDAEMIVTPSDHLILDEASFTESMKKGLDFAAGNDILMTIGIKPTNPNTGYGYIQAGTGSGLTDKIMKVKTFTEKPNLEIARSFVESGEFLWNSGIFIWKVNSILTAIKEFLPDTYRLFNSILPYYNTSREEELIQRVYSECKAISIDFGVMEKASNVYVLGSEFGWSDIGTWGSLYEHSPKDENGNVVSGNEELYDTRDCIVKISGDKIVVAEGLSDYIIVESGNVLLICPRANEQNIRKYVDEVKFRRGDKYI